MNEFESAFPKTIAWMTLKEFQLAEKAFEAELHGDDETDLLDMSHLFPGYLRQQGEERQSALWRKASWIADWEWTREFVESLREEWGTSQPRQFHVIASGQADRTVWRLNSSLQPVLIPDEDVRLYLKCPSLILFFINRAGDFSEVAGDEVTAEVLEAFNEKDAWNENEICEFISDTFEAEIIRTELRRLEREGILVISETQILNK